MIDYLFIVVFVALESFFSGSETGFYCVSRMRLRMRREAGWPGAEALAKLASKPEAAISTMLVGTNISVYMASLLCARKLTQLGLGHRADLYSSLILPPVLLIFAEIIPKSLFQRRADALMYRTAWPLLGARALFRPVTVALDVLSHTLRRLAGRLGGGASDDITADKLRFFFSEGVVAGALSSYQGAMAGNVLHVRSLSVRSVMVPLEKVAMSLRDATRGELRALLASHHYSRLPVYEERRENIVGVVNMIDLIGDGAPEEPITPLVRAPLCIDAGFSVAEALVRMQRERAQMAVVTEAPPAEGGELRSAVGIVTVKDLVEEIVGELADW